jgi:rhodanese-related sulfurtransferase
MSAEWNEELEFNAEDALRAQIESAAAAGWDDPALDVYNDLDPRKIPSGSCPEKGTKEAPMAHQHSPRFLKLVEDAKKRVKETAVDQVKARLDRGEKLQLVDVREESEYAKDHLPGAVHLGKGIIERDVEQRFPDTGAEIILYCGGGFRSALAADNLQKMGYANVISMDGGVRGWRDKGYPMTKG